MESVKHLFFDRIAHLCLSEDWSDSQIAKALGSSIDTACRTRQQLVTEGFESMLTHKHLAASAKPRIFDGATELELGQK
jgi:hypothetical protein